MCIKDLLNSEIILDPPVEWPFVIYAWTRLYLICMKFQIVLVHTSKGHKTVIGNSPDEAKQKAKNICQKFKGSYIFGFLPREWDAKITIPEDIPDCIRKKMLCEH